MKNHLEYEKQVLDALNIDHSTFPEEILENLNIPYLIGTHFFRKKDLKSNRKQAEIDFVIKNKINYSSTFNTYYEFMKRFVKVDCPQCGEVLTGSGGGGSGHDYHIDYQCGKCGTKVNLCGNPEGGFFMKFKED